MDSDENNANRPHTPVRRTTASVHHGELPARDRNQTLRDEVEEKLTMYGRIRASRDDLVVEGDSTGFSEVQIARFMGHSRTTIRGILKSRGARDG